jgi:hypothetical protein
MPKYYRSYLGIWVLSVTIVLRILYMLYIYAEFKKFVIANNVAVPPFLHFISFLEKISICVLFAELIVYVLIRHRIFKLQWVRLHVWPVLFAVVGLPLILIGLRMYIVSHARPDEVISQMKSLHHGASYFFWGVIAVAHAFFITTIAKSFTPQNDPVDESPPGLLDEFVD